MSATKFMRKTTPLTPKTTQDAVPSRAGSELADLLRLRKSWLAEIDPQSLFHKLFDLLPGVYFFAKNRRGEVMFVSRSVLELYGMSDESQMLGRTDFDLNPERMAKSYVRDDDHIYATGKPLLNRMELWFDREGVPDWFVVHKLPICSQTGKIIGIMGILQSYTGRQERQPPFADITAAVALIRQDYARPLTIQDLARSAGLSTRQLQRKFRTTLGISPQEMLIKTRVLAAQRALSETRLSLAEVADTCGFYDQSSFTQHFRKHTGVTPAAFRRKEGRRNGTSRNE